MTADFAELLLFDFLPHFVTFVVKAFAERIAGRWLAVLVLYSLMLKQILDILACPVPECRKPLKLAPGESSLECTGCRRVYPIRDGIPILLIDQAKMPQ